MTSQDKIESMQDLRRKIQSWTKELRRAGSLIEVKPNSQKPYENIYQAIKKVKSLVEIIEPISNHSSVQENSIFKLWLTFSLIHATSSLAKFNEACEELGEAESYHKKCLQLIECVLDEKQNPQCVEIGTYEENEEYKMGIIRCRYMKIYELTRFAILCSERDNQEEALELLKRAEAFYHQHNSDASCISQDISMKSCPILASLDALNSESSKDMFTYVLFYLGQAYRIKGDKELAVLYLHMVLRKQLEKGDYNHITWACDTARMGSVVLINLQDFGTARNMLVAATAVLNNTPIEEKETDHFKQNWADLGRIWAKLGVELLEASADRLKDLEEQMRKPPKFKDKIILTDIEMLSLEINDPGNEFYTLLLVKSLEFPTLETSEFEEKEMRGRYVRDFDEARGVFLPLQRWINAAKEYYIIDEFAGDYIDIMTDYSNAFRHLAFFEPNIERQIKMHKRRISILESLVSSLNHKVYFDVCHFTLRELAEIYEKIYKLKVMEIKDRGESLRPKDKKLVKKLTEAINAHKRNLKIFDLNLGDTKKDFPPEHEKTLLGSVLSIGRILGSISHDHPLHPDAITFAVEGKDYYQFFLEYLDRRPPLKEDFKVLYEGSQDIPSLLDAQIDKIGFRLRNLGLES